MSARIRRLTADWTKVQSAFVSHPFIRVIQTEATPPEKYTFAMHVEGLVPVGEKDYQSSQLLWEPKAQSRTLSRIRAPELVHHPQASHSPHNNVHKNGKVHFPVEGSHGVPEPEFGRTRKQQ